VSDYDVIAIGGGAGGLSVARSARWAGRSVCLVTDGEPGGDCTFTGCVPSKAMISVAAGGGTFAQAMERVRTSIATIAATESSARLREDGVDVQCGRGRLLDANTVDVDGTRLSASRAVIATGAAPVVPPIPGLAEIDALTNESVFELADAPASLAVLGGGPVGCELAQVMARLGVRVFLYEALDRVLSREEPLASAVVHAALEADGATVRVGQRVARFEPIGANVRVITDDGAVDEVERVLVSAGRRPVTDGLGLDQVGVQRDRGGHIVVNDRLETSVKGIFAVGDVTGRLPFTHAADEMGRVAAGHALGLRPRWRFDPTAIPWTTFTDPEVARIGPTEAEAASMGAMVAELPMTEFDRAIVDGRTEGFVKIIAGPKRWTRRAFGGQIIGATVVGPRAGELINELALAVRTGMFTGRLGQTVHAYPTWGSAIPKTVAQFFYEIEGRKARPARGN